MQPTSRSESNVAHSISDKLTLYLIGHAPDAEYLKRLIGQVAPAVDHICFVCTDEKPDCHEVLGEGGIPFTFRRLVFASREDFDFSQARNMARRMAAERGGWAMWLDCDDEVPDADKILPCIAKQPSDAYAIMYDVSATSSNLIKIRIHRADEWHWVNKVHEELVPLSGKVSDKQLALIKSVTIKHSPNKGKSNHEFHVSLLKKSCTEAPNEFCYIGKEYFNIGQWQEAIPWLRKAIATHEHEIEVYNSQIMLGICLAQTGDERGAVDAWHDAIRTRPWRREGYYYIAEVYGRRGGDWLRKGFAHIRAGNALGDESEPMQNAVIYDLLCWKLNARYLQRAKRWEQAIEVMRKAKRMDEEAEQIIAECESEIEQSGDK